MIKNGSIYKSKEGISFEVIQASKYWCTIRCQAKGVMSRAKANDILSGNARLYRNNGGYVACNSIGEYEVLIKTTAYKCWVNMLNRVGKGRYKNVSIHREWLNFNQFKLFYDKWYREGFVLDKDILSDGEKVYSESTCCFVPSVLNTAIRECSTLTNNGSKNTSFTMYFHTMEEVVSCKTNEERDALYKIYRVVKIRTLLSLYDTQIRPEAVEKLYKLYSIKNYGKNTD